MSLHVIFVCQKIRRIPKRRVRISVSQVYVFHVPATEKYKQKKKTQSDTSALLCRVDASKVLKGGWETTETLGQALLPQPFCHSWCRGEKQQVALKAQEHLMYVNKGLRRKWQEIVVFCLCLLELIFVKSMNIVTYLSLNTPCSPTSSMMQRFCSVCMLLFARNDWFNLV